MAAGPSRVYLHVGLPKTGTTHIQEMLWHNRATVAAQGLLYPGYIHYAHFHAAVDLQRRRYETWFEPVAAGAWGRIVAHARRWPDRSVITNELLVTADEESIERALRSLDFAEVHVICTARDLARQIPSVWQENIRNRHTESYTDFLAAIHRRVPNPVGDLFWEYQDLVAVLAKWGRALPPSHVHVITVPGRGAPGGLLWRRFAGVVGIDAESCEPPGDQENRSLGAAQTELLRRINMALPSSVEWPSYHGVVKEYLAAEVLAAQGDDHRITLPSTERGWVRERSELVVRQIAAAGYDVVGDLAELVPDTVAEPPPDVAERELLDAAVSALAELAGRLPTNPDRDQPADRMLHALRSFTEHHRPMMALRRWYWQGKARVSWARGPKH